MITFYTQIIWIHSPRAYAKETLLERFKYPDTLKYKVCPDAPPKTNLEPGTWKSRTPLEKEKYHETSTRPNHQFLKIVGFQNLVFRYIPYITVVNKKTHRRTAPSLLWPFMCEKVAVTQLHTIIHYKCLRVMGRPHQKGRMMWNVIKY